MVISLVYCSGVACPGITALFKPSMPMLIAPDRFTLALSINKIRNSGFFSLALIAAIGPAVPPPTTTMSYSCSRVLIESQVIICCLRLLHSDVRRGSGIGMHRPDNRDIQNPAAYLRWNG